MKKFDEVIALLPDLTRADLDRWLGESLIVADEPGAGFSDTQFARVRLICTLRYDMDVEEETLPVILDLLDQLHDTRERLYALCQAVAAQDDDIRQSVLDLLEQAGRRRR